MNPEILEREAERTCPEAGGCDSCPNPQYCRGLRVGLKMTDAQDEADSFDSTLYFAIDVPEGLIVTEEARDALEQEIVAYLRDKFNGPERSMDDIFRATAAAEYLWSQIRELRKSEPGSPRLKELERDLALCNKQGTTPADHRRIESIVERVEREQVHG